MPVNTIDLQPGGGPNAPFGLIQDTSFGIVSASTGTATYPSINFNSEISLGFWRSRSSTIQMSYGTFVTTDLWVTSQLSVGAAPQFNSGISVGSAANGGTLIPAISSMSSLVGAFVVQGSASSFTGIAWPAAAIGDIILTGVFKSGAASSVSSGLVPWSHVTVAGQIEFRLSNVSTLVQNQSAQTWVFTRVTPF